jgi:hypothetical protein
MGPRFRGDDADFHSLGWATDPWKLPGEFGDVRHEERAITPIAGGTVALLIWLGALLAAPFKEIKNRGNELKDLLQRQGITEIAASKRTHFGDCHGLPSPRRSGLTRSGVGQALPLRIRAEKAALGAERIGISRIVTARRPLARAVLRGPG